MSWNCLNLLLFQTNLEDNHFFKANYEKKKKQWRNILPLADFEKVNACWGKARIIFCSAHRRNGWQLQVSFPILGY